MVSIEQIRPEVTWYLRKEVLYPNEPLYAMEMAEDQHGLHFGAFDEDGVVGVVSLFQKGSDFQFRKFAIVPRMQGKGIGRMLLRYIIDYARNGGGTRLWCNARHPAIGFYLKEGFRLTGEKFNRAGYYYEIMEKDL